MSLFPWQAKRGDLLAGLSNAASIMINVLDNAFTHHLMCRLWSDSPGITGLQTCDPRGTAGQGRGPHLETAVVDGGISADVQGLQRGQLRKLKAVGIAEVEGNSGRVGQVIADVQFLQM